MSLDYPRAFGPSVRHALASDELVEIGNDGPISLLRPSGPERDVLVLHQRPPATSPVLAEGERLLWLAGRGSAPPLVASARADEGDEALVVRLSAGAVTASDGHPMGPEALVTALAEALRLLHALDTAECPLRADVAALRPMVDQQIERHGAASPDGPYAGREPAEVAALFDDALAALPATDDPPVFVHASLSASRLWFDPAGSVTLTGWGRGGVGDRHLDLAAAAMMLTELHGPALVGPFFDAYGFDRVDLRRLDAFQMLAALLK
jgi:aminoglycoside 3'-phosphotransferase-2